MLVLPAHLVWSRALGGKMELRKGFHSDQEFIQDLLWTRYLSKAGGVMGGKVEPVQVVHPHNF